MFNKNYLGHSFFDLNEDFNGRSLMCEICKIKVFYYESKIYKNADEYSIRYGQGFEYYDRLISCNEIVIKNIIE